jgi:hypothetical protein
VRAYMKIGGGCKVNEKALFRRLGYWGSHYKFADNKRPDGLTSLVTGFSSRDVTSEDIARLRGSVDMTNLNTTSQKRMRSVLRRVCHRGKYFTLYVRNLLG